MRISILAWVTSARCARVVSRKAVTKSSVSTFRSSRSARSIAENHRLSDQAGGAAAPRRNQQAYPQRHPRQTAVLATDPSMICGHSTQTRWRPGVAFRRSRGARYRQGPELYRNYNGRNSTFGERSVTDLGTFKPGGAMEHWQLDAKNVIMRTTDPPLNGHKVTATVPAQSVSWFRSERGGEILYRQSRLT